MALWRYLEHGEIPAGAVLKPAAPEVPSSLDPRTAGKEHIIMVKGRRARKVRGSLHSDRQKKGRLGNWGLPVRFARMQHEVHGSRPARIEVRPGTGSNARHTPTSDQDASPNATPCRRHNAEAMVKSRPSIFDRHALDKQVLIEADQAAFPIDFFEEFAMNPSWADL